MAVFGTNNISLSAVRAALGESSNSLYALCNSSKINKWAKYSPQTNQGEYIPFTCNIVTTPFSCAEWTHTPSTTPKTRARLGDFRRYNSNALVPVQGGFPEKLYSNLNNTFMFATTPDEGDSINCSNVFNRDELYFGVGIRRLNDNRTLMWCTSSEKGKNSVVLDISNAVNFQQGEVVECVIFYSQNSKTLHQSNMTNDFYSLKADSTVIDRMQYTVETYTPPTQPDTYQRVNITATPTNGEWSTDYVQVSNISVSITGATTYSYRLKVEIVTQDNNYTTSYTMPSAVTVNAGETKQVLNTQSMKLYFYSLNMIAYIKVIDINNNNKIIGSYPLSYYSPTCV